MQQQPPTKNPRTELWMDLALVAFLIGFDVTARVLPHIPGVMPVAASALFAGRVLRTPVLAVIVPLAAMALSGLALSPDTWQVTVVVYAAIALPAIAAPRNSIKQILVNLVKNAAEALAQGQTITIQTEDAIYIGKDPFVGVIVADDGPGLPPQVLEALFEPVASTKGKGHSGLGLSITKRLVDEVGGRIACRSNAAQGTRFQILIPRRLPDEKTS
ncbi:MAG: ATP-binding protein [Acidihalobacter sp.]